MKNKVLRILSYVLVAVAASAVTICVCLSAQNRSTGKLRELENLLEKYYIGEADMAAVEDEAAAAMVAALGDRWSHYMTAEEYLIYQDNMSNSYVGVGLTVQVREDDQGLDVTEVASGGGADTAGLLPGDRLIAVDGESILGADVNTVAGLIRGEEGTAVELTVERSGETLHFTVTRSRIQTAVATYQLLEDGVGLITIENFDDRCAEETIEAVEALREQGATSLIFDVRNNPGGYKRELVELLDYLLPEGEIFRTEDYKGREQVDTSDKDYLDIPMAVLINANSYSAAEFFAAALEEYDAAITVGEKTSGKGYYQNTFALSDGSAVSLSIGKYYTPKGKSLADVGLTPQVEELVDEETAAKIVAGLLKPEEDSQIQAAINALKGGN